MQNQPSISPNPQDHIKDDVSDAVQTTHHPITKALVCFPINNKEIILKKEKFSKSLLTHSKTSKSAKFSTVHRRSDLHFMKDCQKVLRNQRQLSKLNFFLETPKHFENTFLLSQIRHLSSLSSLTLEFALTSRNNPLPERSLFKSVTCLKKLKNLDLFFTCLILDDPELFKNLEKALRKATKITDLSLVFYSCYNLTSLHYSFLLSRLPKFNHLRALKLCFYSSDYLQEADINTFISILPKLSFLTTIDLDIGASGRKIIQGSSLVEFCKAFRSMKNLSDLGFHISGWELVSLDHERCLLESLKCLVGSLIEKLSLRLFQNFSNQNLEELSKALKEFTLLESFRFDIFEGQLLEDELIIQFGLALGCMTSLISLSLYCSSRIMHKNIVQAIATALASLQKLVSLRLELRSKIETADEQFQALFAHIKSLRSIKYLHLEISGQKKLTDASLETLGESLKDLNALKNLYLAFDSNSSITNKGIDAICSGIKEGPHNLFCLSLILDSHENVNEKALQEIGRTLKSLISLYSFALKIGGCCKEADLEELFYVLGQMKNIQEIWLSFPKSKGNFREIEYLKKIKDTTVYFSKDE